MKVGPRLEQLDPKLFPGPPLDSSHPSLLIRGHPVRFLQKHCQCEGPQAFEGTVRATLVNELWNISFGKEPRCGVSLVVRNLPASEGDTGSVRDPGGPHVPRSHGVRELQRLRPARPGTRAPPESSAADAQTPQRGSSPAHTTRHTPAATQTTSAGNKCLQSPV